MYFVIASGFVGLVCVFGAFVFLVPKSHHFDGILRQALNEDAICNELVHLARACNKTKNSGAGLSLYYVGQKLRATFAYLCKKVDHEQLLHMERWLYDNYFYLSRVCKRIKTSSFAELPHVLGKPRLYLLLDFVVKHTEARVDERTLARYLHTFLQECPLVHSELMCFFDMLCFCLLEYCAVLAGKCEFVNRKIDLAKTCKIDLKILEQAKYASFCFGLNSRINAEERGFVNGILTTPIEQKVQAFAHLVARYNTLISGAVLSLKKIEGINWQNFVLESSALHKVFCGERAGIYKKSTQKSQLILLNSLAEREKTADGQLFAAKKLIDKANEQHKNVAELLLAKKSKPFLEACFALLVLVVSFAASIYFCTFFYGIAMQICVGIFAFVPMFCFFYKLCGRFFSAFCKSELLAVEELERCACVMPVLVKNSEDLKRAVQNLDAIRHANKEKCLDFVVLCDFCASNSSSLLATEQEILDFAQQLVQEFCNIGIIFRGKTQKIGEKFCGWERKRGAVLQFLQYLQGRFCFEYDLFCKSGHKYAFVLDEDTFCNTIAEHIRIAEHPCNDFAVFAPQMTTRIEQNDTAFGWLFGGQRGAGGYENWHNFGMDMFGRGAFCGKGLLNVARFLHANEHRFLPQTVLSHDFIEGAFAKTANVGLLAFDGFPKSFKAYLARALRWIRGDWQLIGFLLPRAKNANGEKVACNIGVFNRLFIFANLCSSLLAINACVLIVLSIFAGKLFYLLALLGLFYLLFPLAMDLICGLCGFGYRQKAARIFYDRLCFLLACVVQIALVPCVAIFSFVAITKTLFRVMVSKKNLLEWTTFAHAGSKQSAKDLGILFFFNVIFACGILLLALFFAHSFVVYAALFGVFLLAPVLVFALSYEKKHKVRHGQMLTEYARKMWGFFASTLKPEYNFLPCDNFQELNGKGFAHRTSPTNIGFALVAVCVAQKFGFIFHEQAKNYVQKMLQSVEKMKKHLGLLYNWYDTRTLAPLYPKYLSSADCGNLAACLMLVRAHLLHQNEHDLAEKIAHLLNKMRLDFFLDAQRELFFVGFDAERGAYDNAHYDLVASEAFLTYVVAYALGKIDSQPLMELSRERLGGNKDCYASWTGGLFEYLMPALFVDFVKKTQLYASARHAVLAHKRQAKKSKLPIWGFSEGQYDSVNSAGDYEYKAFGAQSICIKNVQKHKVVASYGSFLALKFGNVFKNLNRLAKYSGQFGAYEAVDFCKGERVVKSFMAHHLGMSMLAICNYCHDFSSILQQESGIVAAKMMFNVLQEGSVAPKKWVSKHEVQRVKAVKKPSFVQLLTNGKYALAVHKNGASCAHFEGVLQEYDNCGLDIRLQDMSGESIFCEADVRFLEGVCTFEKKVGMLNVSSDVFVARDINAQIRQVCITNMGKKTVKVRLIGYALPCLCDRQEMIAHPSFCKMFMRTGFDEKYNYVSATRTIKEQNYTMFLSAIGEQFEYTTSRFELFNRGFDGQKCGEVRDAALSASVEFELKKGEKRVVSFLLGAAHNIKEVQKSMLIASSLEYVSFAKSAASAFAEQHEDRHLAQQIVHAGWGIAMDKKVLPKQLEAVMGLGIGTNKPLFVVVYCKLNTRSFADILQQLRFATNFLQSFNLAVLYFDRDNYFTPQRDEVMDLLHQSGIYEGLLGSYVFVLNKNSLSMDAINGIFALSVLELSQPNELNSAVVCERMNYVFADIPNKEHVSSLPMGFGALQENNNFYANITNADTPAPYCNVIANKSVGTILTESGLGYTYFDNSRQNKVTSWCNDPLSNKVSEQIFVVDEDGKFCVTKQPYANPLCEYGFEHGLGYTKYTCKKAGVFYEATHFLGEDKKYIKICINNTTALKKELEIGCKLALVLGDFWEYNVRFLQGEICDDNLKISNYATKQQVFVGCSHEKCQKSYKNGFASLSQKIKLNAKENTEIYFYLSKKEFLFDKNNAQKIYEKILSNTSVSKICMHSPNKALDFMLDRLMYQTLNSRFFARAGFYQSGGAIGFRDQLQDCLALLYYDTKLVKEHILLCCGRQFEQGDVLHWWHPPFLGVRTRIADDRLFLPYVLCEYVKFTGDLSILDVRVPFCEGMVLGESNTVFDHAVESQSFATVLEHAQRAIDCTFDFAKNGLCKMHGGDWNDAMDKVGEQGEGSSVWLSMFLCACIRKILPYCNKEKAAQYSKVLHELLSAIDKHGWDGAWFLRAFCDDGSVLGSKKSAHCQIDLICQAWATLGDICDKNKQKIALDSAYDRLVDEKNRIIKLLTPPFENGNKIGYIQHYPQGVRENGGQYTHAAMWYILALFKAGRADEAYKLLDMVNPLSICATRAGAQKYASEPYALCGDVYSGAFKGGRGGWSWYTGASAWMYKCVVEGLLGLEVVGNRVKILPSLPQDFEQVCVDICLNNIDFCISIVRDNVQETCLQVENIKYSNSEVELTQSLQGKTVIVKIPLKNN